MSKCIRFTKSAIRMVLISPLLTVMTLREIEYLVRDALEIEAELRRKRDF